MLVTAVLSFYHKCIPLLVLLPVVETLFWGLGMHQSGCLGDVVEILATEHHLELPVDLSADLVYHFVVVGRWKT